MEIPIEGCKGAYAFKASSAKKYALLSLLIALYAMVLPYCYYTSGEPRYNAMLNAQRIADERWMKESSSSHILAESMTGNANTTTGIDATISASGESVQSIQTVSEDSSIVSSTPNTSVVSKSSPKDTLNEFDLDADENEATNAKSLSSTESYILSFFSESKESKRAKKELKELKKSFATLTNEEGNPISLPPSYLPSAWACLALFALLTCHALFHLLCHWLVFFKAYALYSSTTALSESTVLLVIPVKNRGKPSFVNVKKSPISHQYQIEFQRQTYIYTPSAKLGKNSQKYPNGVLTLTSSPISLPISQYIQATGLRSEVEINSMTEKFGKNHLAVPIPSFFDLLAQQLVSPLTMFQIFCAILWLLDEYWTFTLWSLVSVLVFEATTVFQRSKTQSMLTSMAPKAIPIYIYRLNQWKLLTTKDILPSDIISLHISRPSIQSGGTTQPGNATPKPPAGVDLNIVPCDCVILKGSAVVNEASLTGESVPQMKEAITFDNSNSVTSSAPSSSGTNPIADGSTAITEEERLDMNGTHRVNTLFSGTTIVNIDNKSNGEDTSPLPNIIASPPDHGIIAYVLRTGFNSSQGTLLQMIEFSQQTVSGDAVEVGFAILLLFIFALISAGYVLSEGLRKKEKTTHELLLKCVMIITSVVPRQLPMQMAVAVNMALMTLTKQGIFCTEPHRVPIGGKISHCLFDKTGTLTTDQLVPVGIIDVSHVTSTNNDSTSDLTLLQVSEASQETAMVLAACHSLVEVDDSSQSTSGDVDPDAAIKNESESSAPSKAVKKSIVGDPIELAALQGVEWTWNGQESVAIPGNFDDQVIKIEAVQKKIEEIHSSMSQRRGDHPVSNLEVQNAEKQLTILRNSLKVLQDKLAAAQRKASNALYQRVQVLQRHHFSSKLQRMSVITICNNEQDKGLASKTSSQTNELYCLVKGSPEAIKSLLVADHIPSWYVHQYESMARRGLRVLALAYKKLPLDDIPADYLSNIPSLKGFDPKNSSKSNKEWLKHAKDIAKDLPRSFIESKLYFAGFIAFECKIRADSKVVIQSLKESRHKVMMVTGDSLLTSLHVAKQVGISACNSKRFAAILTAQTDDSSKDKVSYCWSIQHEDGSTSTMPLAMNELQSMCEKYSLLTTESDLLGLADATGGKLSPLWGNIECFEVFARMSPHGKATIIRALQQGNIHDVDGMDNQTANSKVITVGHKKDVFVLMCGDGGNDVGALKQADIGLALLAGHANANTTEDVLKTPNQDAVATTNQVSTEEAVTSSEDALNSHQKRLEARAAEINAKRMAHMKVYQAKYQKEQQVRLQEEIRVLTEKGEYMATFSLMKQQAIELKRALDAENARFMALHGQVWDPSKDPDNAAGTGGGFDTSAADNPGGLPMLRPGDASVAAPFTSRIPSIRAVVDLIRQGRCTLLSALMQQQIMMLESIIAAFTLSALSLHNSRGSERQMMASSMLISTAAISFSYASPLDHMHPVRPLKSLFHPAIIFSIFGQALIHIACMSLAVKWATDAMGPEKLHEVTEFFRKVKAHEIDRSEHCGEDDFMCQLNSFWMAPFIPNLLNSVVFLVETSQMISVFFTNYKGRPWMKGMLENHALFLSVFMCVAGVIVCAWEFVPQANEMIQLAPFPNDAFRYKVVFLVISTIFGTLLWDRLCVVMFAKDISKASLDEFKRLSIKDFFPVLKTAGMVIVGLFMLSTGNLLWLGIGYWYYRQYYMKKPAQIAGPPMQGQA